MINSYYCYQWVFLKLCGHSVNVLKMWLSDGVRISSDRIELKHYEDMQMEL